MSFIDKVQLAKNVLDISTREKCSSLAPSNDAGVPNSCVPFDALIGIWKVPVLTLPSLPGSKLGISKQAGHVSEAVVTSQLGLDLGTNADPFSTGPAVPMGFQVPLRSVFLSIPASFLDYS